MVPRHALACLRWLYIALVALIPSPPAKADGPAAVPVAVRVLAVDESRHLHVNSSIERNVSTPVGLKLTLELSGAPLESATNFGGLKLDKAVDDQGNNLLGDVGSFQHSNLARFEKIDRSRMWFFADEKPKDKLKVEVDLKPASRSAAKLKALTGSIRVGRSTDIAFDDLARRVGKPLADKGLAEAKVALTLTKVGDKGEEGISYSLDDPNGYVAEVRLVDASGKDITQGRWSMSFGTLKSYSLSAKPGPMPAGVKLIVALMAADTVLTVPIDLKDVPLP